MDKELKKITELEIELKKLSDKKEEYIKRQEYASAAQIRDQERDIRKKIKRLKKTN